MELTLSDDDVRTLRALLSDHLREFRLEVARTEAKDFRHALLIRQELVERVLAQLEAHAQGATPPPPTPKSP